MTFGVFTSKDERLIYGGCVCRLHSFTKKVAYTHPHVGLCCKGLFLVSALVCISTENQNYEGMNKVERKLQFQSGFISYSFV